MEEALEKGFELKGAGNGLLDFDELASGKFFPPRADWGVVAEAAQEKPDFSEGETHFGGKADQEYARKSVACIPALAAFALGRSEEAAFFVIADGGGVEAGAAGELADFHDGAPDSSLREMPLDLKLTLSFSIPGWDVANPNWRKAMKNRKERVVEASMRGGAIVALTLLVGGSGAMGLGAQNSAIVVQPERQVGTVQSKFYCNIKALTPEERARHKQLSEKLMAAQKEIVETQGGYEFQFSPADVSLAELAEWVAAESKCCPFFDFHIDLEHEGKLGCLRLTGEEGIKAFIRAEFKIEK